jgi:hypothetical protein
LDGKFFAFNGELILGQGVLVEIPAQWFNMTAQVQVPTINNIRAQLAANASPTLTLGPYAGGNPDTVAFKTRAAMVLPHKYASLFQVQSNGIPLRYYFNTILSLLEADGTAGACVALTKYCQTAITVSARGESTLQVVPPTPPARNVTLLMQSHLLLRHYFPTLLGARPPAHDLQLLVVHLTTYQNEQTVCQDQAWQEKIKKERTTVAVWLGPENFSRLLHYSQVISEDYLSPLYKALAGAPARDRLMILQGKVCGELLSIDAVFSAEEFTVNLKLLTHLTSLQWAMITPDSLETGCLGNAFLFTDSNVEECQCINKQLQLIQSGDATPSLSDAQSILKMKVNLPGADNSIHCILRMQAFFCAVLPIGHPITSFLTEHYQVMKAFDPGWAHHKLPIPC